MSWASCSRGPVAQKRMPPTESVISVTWFGRGTT